MDRKSTPPKCRYHDNASLNVHFLRSHEKQDVDELLFCNRHAAADNLPPNCSFFTRKAAVGLCFNQSKRVHMSSVLIVNSVHLSSPWAARWEISPVLHKELKRVLIRTLRPAWIRTLETCVTSIRHAAFLTFRWYYNTKLHLHSFPKTKRSPLQTDSPSTLLMHTVQHSENQSLLHECKLLQFLLSKTAIALLTLVIHTREWNLKKKKKKNKRVGMKACPNSSFAVTKRIVSTSLFSLPPDRDH